MITIGDAVLFLSANSKQYDSDLKGAERKAQGWVSTVGEIVKTGAGNFLGFLSRDLFMGVIHGFQDIAGAALTSVANYERLGLSLESLVARELMRGQTVEQTSQQIVKLTEAEKAKIGELTDAYRLKEIAVAKTQSEIDAILAKGADANNLAIEERQIKIRALQADMAEFRGEIDKLQSKDGQLVNVIQQVTVGQMSHAEAMAAAGPKAKELLEWITKLSVLSPFKQSEVADAFQQAMAYGFTADQAKRLTTALINFAAGAGKSGDTMNRIALALGQIQAKGKLAGQEVLQLVNAGLPVTEILAKAFNKTTAEIESMRENGLIKADDAIKAIVETLETDFAGAAERQATSWAGLTSTLSDLKDLGLREFFTGTFTVIQPYAEKFVNLFTEGDTLEKIRAIGDALGEKVGGALQWFKDNGVPVLQEMWKWIKYFFWAVEDGQNPLDVLKKIFWALLPPELKDQLKEIADALAPVTGPIGDMIKAIAENDPTAFFDAVDRLGPALTTLFGGLWAQIQPEAEKFAADVDAWLTQKGIEIGNSLANKWGAAFVNWIAPKIPEMQARNEDAMNAIRAWIAQKAVELPRDFYAWATASISWIGAKTPEALANLGTFLGTLVAWTITDGIPLLILAGQQMSFALINWITTDLIPNVGPKFLEFKASQEAFFSGVLIPALIEMGKNFVEALIKGLTERQPQFIENWRAVGNNIKIAVDGYKDMLVTLGQGILDHIGSGIMQRVSHLIGIVRGAMGSVLDAAGQMLGDFNPLGGGSTGGGETKNSAGGNRLKAGQPSIVGELGRELWIPDTDGFILPSVPDLSKAASGFGGNQRIVLEVPVVLDGREVGRVSVDGTLDELAARGLKVVPA